jgi:ABC-type multidrug transport system ATPase subunit
MNVSSIWKYLMSLSSGTKKATILITTHYIEEARQATKVGLMRNGRLLAEDPPNSLVLNSAKMNHHVKLELA